MLHLKENPTILDFQNYVRALEEERGFAKDTRLQKCLLLGEELGELCEAIRTHHRAICAHKIVAEIADILIILFSIANRLNGIDLDVAVQKKLIVSKNTNVNNSLSKRISHHKMPFSAIQQLAVFTSETPIDLYLQLVEDFGQLFKSIRKIECLKVDCSSKVIDTNGKFADLILSLCHIANFFEFDLETAFRDKEEVNKKRTWVL